MIKAVIFDVGHTLVDYKNPLNWSVLYRDALIVMYQNCGVTVTESKINKAIGVLSKYNTRMHPRQVEVLAEQIFKEIFRETEGWENGDKPVYLDIAICAFFAFFQSGAVLYKDTKDTLKKLKDRNLKIGVLTDSAYGMPRQIAFQDFCELEPYLDLWFTSVDIGYRKPSIHGYLRFSDEWGIEPDCILYVGDEEKDMIGANHAGMHSVLIDRKRTECNYGQTYTISCLSQLLDDYFLALY